jgi:hypothetical protein
VVRTRTAIRCCARFIERDAPDLDADFHGRSLRDTVLEPTRIYVKPLLALMKEAPGLVKGLAHITGGGLLDNVPRVLPAGLSAHIDASSWTLPPLFAWLREAGNVAEQEMYRVFNCGIGMVVIVAEADADRAMASLSGQPAKPCIASAASSGAAKASRRRSFAEITVSGVGHQRLVRLETRQQANEKPASSGFFIAALQLRGRQETLLELGFLVDHVLARLRIELHDFHLFRLGALVLRGRVEMTGTGCRFQLDLVASALGHDVFPSYLCRQRPDLRCFFNAEDAPAERKSDFLAASADFGEYGFNTLLVYRTQTFGAHTQADETTFGLQPETALLEIGQEAALGFVVGMGNVVTHHRRLPGNLANAGHVLAPEAEKLAIIADRSGIVQVLHSMPRSANEQVAPPPTIT